MADITMCGTLTCHLKENCYRYLAPANEYRQSYFAIPPIDPETLECEYFWNYEEYTK